MANAATLTYAGRTIDWLRMKGTGSEPLNAGWGTLGGSSSVTAAANANVNLFGPATEARQAGTTSLATTSFLGDTYKNIVTITCLVGAKTIGEVAYFDTTTLSGTSTLSASITSIATSMTLAANIGPTTGAYYAQVGNETILVTGANSTTLTIARAQLGSIGALQAAGSPVTSGGDGGAGANGATSGQTATIGAAQGGNCFLHADHGQVALSINDSISYTTSTTLT